MQYCRLPKARTGEIAQPNRPRKTFFRIICYLKSAANKTSLLFICSTVRNSWWGFANPAFETQDFQSCKQTKQIFTPLYSKALIRKNKEAFELCDRRSQAKKAAITIKDHP
jgi:hypothetical protein